MQERVGTCKNKLRIILPQEAGQCFVQPLKNKSSKNNNKSCKTLHVAAHAIENTRNVEHEFDLSCLGIRPMQNNVFTGTHG